MSNLKWIFVLLIGFSCSKEEVEILQVPLIQIAVKEVTAAGSQNIILSCRTEKEYNCSNNSIIAEKEIKAKSIEVAFLGISFPEICATAIGPARREIDLGPLGNGVYEVEILAGTFTNKGILEISEQQVRLEFPQQNGIEILTAVVER